MVTFTIEVLDTDLNMLGTQSVHDNTFNEDYVFHSATATKTIRLVNGVKEAVFNMYFETGKEMIRNEVLLPKNKFSFAPCSECEDKDSASYIINKALEQYIDDDYLEEDTQELLKTTCGLVEEDMSQLLELLNKEMPTLEDLDETDDIEDYVYVQEGDKHNGTRVTRVLF